MLSEQDMEDIHSSIHTVHDRSERLYHFVEKYRSLTRIPPPKIEKISVGSILKNIGELFSTELHEKGIQLQLAKKDDSVEINADPSLIEQVLINLVKNSIHALDGKIPNVS